MTEVQVFEGDGKLPPEFEALKKENANLKEKIAEQYQKIEQQRQTIDTLINRPFKPRIERGGDEVEENEQDCFRTIKAKNNWAEEEMRRVFERIKGNPNG